PGRSHNASPAQLGTKGLLWDASDGALIPASQRKDEGMIDFQYPIGQFAWSGPNTPDERAALINDLAVLPHNLRNVLTGLSGHQLDTSYGDGGWTVRQVVHHLADAHIDGYVRLRLALTEDEPTIKAFDEVAWSELVDAKTGPIRVSLKLLDG